MKLQRVKRKSSIVYESGIYIQASDYTRSTDKVPVVNQAKGKETPSRPSSKPLPKFGNKGQQVKCYLCGVRLRRQEDCRCKNQKCVSCGKTGHISQMCRSKTRARGRDNRTHQVKTRRRKTTSRQFRAVLYLYEVTTRKNASEPPIKTELEVGGETLEVEEDTGATFSFISEVTSKRLWGKRHRLWNLVRYHCVRSIL